jgi:hypothetical protein
MLKICILLFRFLFSFLRFINFFCVFPMVLIFVSSMNLNLIFIIIIFSVDGDLQPHFYIYLHLRSFVNLVATSHGGMKLTNQLVVRASE